MLHVAAYFLPLLFIEFVILAIVISDFTTTGESFHYRITDLWAATLGLTPTLLLTAYTLNVIDLRPIIYWSDEHLIVLSAVLGISQFSGIIIGRVLAGPVVAKQRHATATSAIFVLAGATCGFAAMFFYLFLIKIFLGHEL